MKNMLVRLLILYIASSQLIGLVYSQRIFDVLKYGAVGDGKTDDSKAFVTAWGELCGAADEANDIPTLVIPETKTFLLQPIKFEGPCNSNSVHVQILGKLVAPKTKDAWKGCDDWLQFSNVANLMIDGSGEIDGQGSFWWTTPNQFDRLSLKLQMNKKNCKPPDALHFHGCNNLKLSGLTHLNSPRAHIAISNCNNVFVSHLTIIAPEDSPNTDGIDISSSHNVFIQHTSIGTGDDCIAINGGCSDLNIANIACGPGHGISVGSLGANGALEKVNNVYVKDCSFSGTTNGARIKTWQGGSGYARNITFEKITLDAAKNPIIIDQFYCDRDHDCKSQASAVSVDYVKYIDFEGTSASEEAIKLDCDQNSGCHSIIMDRIKITSAVPGKKIYASCSNAIGTSLGTIVPNVPCLKSGDKPTTSPPAPPLSATPPPSPPLLVMPQPSPPVLATPPIALILPPPPLPDTPTPSLPLPLPSPPLPATPPQSPPLPAMPPPSPPLSSPLPPPYPPLSATPPPASPMPTSSAPSALPLPTRPPQAPPMPFTPLAPLLPFPPSPALPTTPQMSFTGEPGVADMYFTSGATKLHKNHYIWYQLAIVYVLQKLLFEIFG